MIVGDPVRARGPADPPTSKGRVLDAPAVIGPMPGSPTGPVRHLARQVNVRPHTVRRLARGLRTARGLRIAS